MPSLRHMRFPARRALSLGLAGVVALAAACTRPAPKGLTFSTWGSIDEIETLKPLLAEFERANPDVPVTLIHVPNGYPHKVRLMAAAGTMPDVLFLESQTLAGFASRGVLRDLDDRLDADPEMDRAGYFPQALTAMSWQDKLYGVPRDVSNLAIYYNKSLFDKAGEPYPAAGWTHETMVAKAKRLTVADRQWGIGFSHYPLYWLPYLWSDGGDVMDAAMRRCTLLEPANVAALQRYLDLRTRHHVAPTEAEVGNTHPSQLFAQGKLAMMVGGRWLVPGYRKKLTFDWDVAPFPRGRTGSVVDADASGWGIATACERPDDAWRLIRFLAGKKASTAFTASGLIVPARLDVAHSQAFLGKRPPASNRVFLDVLAEARPTQSPPGYNEILYEMIDSLPAAWNGDVPLHEALVPVVRRIDTLLAEERS